MNKINRQDVDDLNRRNILAGAKVYLIKDKASNVAILNKYLPEISAPQGGKGGLQGWFRLGNGQIALEREQLNKIPGKERFQVRSEAAHSLIWLALACGISLMRFGAGFPDAFITTTFRRKR